MVVILLNIMYLSRCIYFSYSRLVSLRLSPQRALARLASVPDYRSSNGCGTLPQRHYGELPLPAEHENLPDALPLCTVHVLQP